MRTLIELRAETPDQPFATRLLPCPDGTTQLVVLPLWCWQTLDTLIAAGYNLDWHSVIGFCFNLAKQAVTQEGWHFDIAFRELLMYYIHRNYDGYQAEQQNLANDNWQDFFTD